MYLVIPMKIYDIGMITSLYDIRLLHGTYNREVRVVNTLTKQHENCMYIHIFMR